MILRTQWSDRHPNLSGVVSLAKKGVGAAVVHHTAGPAYTGADKSGFLRDLEHFVTDHVAPGNSTPLSAIDYSRLIFPDGTIADGRGFQFEDAATLAFNAVSVSWALIGNYDVTPVPQVMVNALAADIVLAKQQGWLAGHPRIIGHRDVGTFATACPGRFAEARLGEIRALVASGGPAQPEEDEMTDEQVQIITGGIQSGLRELKDGVVKAINDGFTQLNKTIAVKK